MTHKATAMPRYTELFGFTYQPVCLPECGFKGGHYRNPERADEAAKEHVKRHSAKTLKRLPQGGSVILW